MLDCIIYFEQQKRGKDVVWIRKALITNQKGEVLFDEEINNPVTKQELLRKFRGRNGKQEQKQR